MAIGEHEPNKLYKRNRGLLSMSHNQLHDFASTPQSGLPQYKKGGVLAARARRKNG